jgi:hypothetical protein
MEKQLTPITIARLEAAGFEADGADKLTRAYKLNTKWQTVTIFHQYRGNGSFTLKGIRNVADRYTTAYVEELTTAAVLFGANQDVIEALRAMKL